MIPLPGFSMLIHGIIVLIGKILEITKRGKAAASILPSLAVIAIILAAVSANFYIFIKMGLSDQPNFKIVSAFFLEQKSAPEYEKAAAAEIIYGRLPVSQDAGPATR